MTKRLFIFAAYDPESVVDESLIYYLRQLAQFGDIIFTMDNDAPQYELYKIMEIPNILCATAIRHCEYDFGSYKRGYIYAEQEKMFDKYDWVYLVNDSVYGPLFNLGPILEKMESENAGGAYGMIGLHSTVNEQYGYPDHIQSWFVAMTSQIAASDWMSQFMHSITHQESKNQIVWKYEVGLSQLLISHGVNIGRLEKKICGLKIYGGYIDSLPFVKKLAIRNIPKPKTLRKLAPTELAAPMMASIARLHLHISPYKTIWKLKLFNKITTLMWEQKRDGSEYRLWFFKIIPIRFLTYKD